MHRAAIFDLGRVLVNFDFARGYRAMEPLCRYSAEEIRKRLAATHLVEDFETGLMEPRDFVARMARILDFDIEYGRFCANLEFHLHRDADPREPAADVWPRATAC